MKADVFNSSIFGERLVRLKSTAEVFDDTDQPGKLPCACSICIENFNGETEVSKLGELALAGDLAQKAHLPLSLSFARRGEARER